jgi:hypothetical protein
MALAYCILGKFLGVGCHCFPPPSEFPPSPLGAFTSNDARDLQQRKVEHFVGEKCSEIFRLEIDFHVILEIFYRPQIYDMGQTALLPPPPPPKEGVLRIFSNSVHIRGLKKNLIDNAKRGTNNKIWNFAYNSLRTQHVATFFRLPSGILHETSIHTTQMNYQTENKSSL